MKTVFSTVFSQEDRGLVQVYSLPPKQALVAAYEQSRGNWNTWEYESRLASGIYEFHKTPLSIRLGEFKVRLP